MSITFFNTSLKSLPKFNTIGTATNISLNIFKNNQQLSNIPNPNSAKFLNTPNNAFLTELKISGNSFSCDCDLGFV